MSEMQLLRSIRGVAPLAGSVDRNDTETLESIYEKLSLPSRGAWIEMNKNGETKGGYMSLPSRGAWIEMQILWYGKCPEEFVAPLAGSVDRNGQIL